jgi:hypothetical protein
VWCCGRYCGALWASLWGIVGLCYCVL